MTNFWEEILIGCAGGAALLVSILALRSEWRTTLVGVWGWRIASTLALVILAMAARAWPAPFDHPLFCYLAGVSLFCPNIALLGAKRPQHQLWHFVVASLWFTLTLPAWQTAWLHPGRTLDVGWIHGGFLWLLIGLEILNRLGTATFFVGVIVAASQLCLLGAVLRGWPLVWKAAEPLCQVSMLPALGLLVLAHVSDYLLGGQAIGGNDDLTLWWRTFRRRFGLLWALRVWLQINAFCQLQSWPVRLGWTGFMRLDGTPVSPQEVLDPGDFASLRQAFVNLLSRFENPLRFNYPSVQ